MDPKKTGDTIQKLRISLGMTQKELALRMGVTDKAVSKWERGIGLPDVSLLPTLCRVFDVDMEDILHGRTGKSNADYCGVIELNYPEGIHADSKIYDKSVIKYQISLFMLASIKCIAVTGEASELELAKRELSGSDKLGLSISYYKPEDTGLKEVAGPEAGVLKMSGLDFIYGKDVTRTIRKTINEKDQPLVFTDNNSNALGISFYPAGFSLDKEYEFLNRSFFRGVIAFKILSAADLLDASFMLSFIEKHMNEKIADLYEISLNRGFLNGESV